MPQTEVGADGNPVAVHVADVTPNLLIMVYLVLTFGEPAAQPNGYLICIKGCTSKVQGYDDGWLVCCYCHR